MVLTARLSAGDPDSVARAAEVLRRGGLVAFPTETVYGLGADGFSETAVARIFEAKGRPADNPLILHVTGPEMLDGVAPLPLPPAARRLVEAFWPGPLTLVLPRGASVPAAVSGGLDTVAVRAPAHPAAQALVAALGRPVAAPSANRSGRPSPTTADDVLEDLGGRIDAVLDGGPTGVGVESTVVDVTVQPPQLLRPGGVPAEEVERVLGVPLALPAAGRPRSPGMKYRHYAPRTPLFLSPPGAEAVLAALSRAARATGGRVGALVTAETAHSLAGQWPGPVQVLGPRGDAATQARRLFAALRSLDRAGLAALVAEEVPEGGLGRAVMDRLRRAASRNPDGS